VLNTCFYGVVRLFIGITKCANIGITNGIDNF